MTVGEVMGIVVCILAVIGLYLLACKVFARISGKDKLVLAVCAFGCLNIEELDEEVRAARIICDGDTGVSYPVLLFDSTDDVIRLQGDRYCLDIYVRQ